MNTVKTALLVLASCIAACCGSVLSAAQPPAFPTLGDRPGLEASNPTGPGPQDQATEFAFRRGGPIDDCNSNGIDDTVDIAAGTSLDCNTNGIPDECELLPELDVTSDQRSPIGHNAPQSYTIPSAPVALGDVVLTISAYADLGDSNEWIDVDLNGLAIGTLFASGGSDCPVVADQEQLVLSAAAFNQAVNGGDAVITLVTTPQVQAGACSPLTYVTVAVQYDTYGDCNGNTIPDECEPNADCNTNGVQDLCDIAAGTSPDCNGNVVPDTCELAGNDCNTNGLPDECEGGCNSNGVPDECELAGNDCNSNGIPDDCDAPDCNTNGLPDVCDIAAGYSPDCDASSVPDECESLADCNSNGVFDTCELFPDCNASGVPDACEGLPDCNSNGVPDLCEVLNTEWVKLTASDATAEAAFGHSVSFNGDVVVIGAYGDDDGGSLSGSAYVYRYNGSGWVEEAKLTASDAAAGDWFGQSVSISGDLAVIGAYADDDAAFNSGSAYVYRYDGSSWVEEAKLNASDAAAGDAFGGSVSVSGDLAVIGAHGDDDAGNSSGSAYVYRYDGSSWVEEAKLTAADANAGDIFGHSVSLSGDVVVIGADGDDHVGSSSGSAYVYRYDGSNWVEEAKLTASDDAAENHFGASVSVSGDLALIGAYFGDGAVGDSGAAYMYRYDGSSWVEEAKLTASDGALYDRFGESVSVSGDLAVIGASGNDDAGSFSGSAYVYRYVGGGWLEQKKLNASDAASSAVFGRSVSVSGYQAVIGARGNDVAGFASGSAYLFAVESFDCNTNGVPDECDPGAGDYDADGDVDGDDFANWPACLTGPALGPYACGCEAFDFDADFDVDLGDFAVFQAIYTGPQP